MQACNFVGGQIKNQNMNTRRIKQRYNEFIVRLQEWRINWTHLMLTWSLSDLVDRKIRNKWKRSTWNIKKLFKL